MRLKSIVVSALAGAMLVVPAIYVTQAQAQEVNSAKAKIDLTTPQGAIQAMRKDGCSLIDEKPIFYTWTGDLYSLRRGEADKKLFKLEGMNVRQCVTVKDDKKGVGFRQVSREIMLYLDPKTGKVLDKWKNPWLNKRVKVIHVANDPVNFGPIFPFNKNGKPVMKWRGTLSDDGMWATYSTYPLFYHNVLQGGYQRFVGGAYHATEMFSSFGLIDDLTDLDKDTAIVQGAWSRISEYLPWMEMQGREGLLYTHATSRKIASFDDLPDVLKTYIKRREPSYMQPPPVTDKRPNETSWTVFKKKLPVGKLPRGGH